MTDLSVNHDKNYIRKGAVVLETMVNLAPVVQIEKILPLGFEALIIENEGAEFFR